MRLCSNFQSISVTQMWVPKILLLEILLTVFVMLSGIYNSECDYYERETLDLLLLFEKHLLKNLLRHISRDQNTRLETLYACIGQKLSLLMHLFWSFHFIFTCTSTKYNSFA
jgi:hypothetical protein